MRLGRLTCFGIVIADNKLNIRIQCLFTLYIGAYALSDPIKKEG